MKIEEYRTTVSVVYAFEDSDEKHILAGHNGNTFLVAQLKVKFANVDDEWKCQKVEVSGYKLKKDGTPGRVWTSSYIFTHKPDTPEWVNKLIADIHPDRSAPHPHIATR